MSESRRFVVGDRVELHRSYGAGTKVGASGTIVGFGGQASYPDTVVRLDDGTEVTVSNTLGSYLMFAEGRGPR